MSSFAGTLRSLLLCLVCRAGVGGGIELVSSGPIVNLKSFVAHPSAAVILLAIRRGTGVMVLLGVCSILAGVGELGVTVCSSSGTGTGAASSMVSTLSTVGGSG